MSKNSNLNLAINALKDIVAMHGTKDILRHECLGMANIARNTLDLIYENQEFNQLMRFYSVTTQAELIAAMESHIKSLQSKIEPMENQFSVTPRA